MKKILNAKQVGVVLLCAVLATACSNNPETTTSTTTTEAATPAAVQSTTTTAAGVQTARSDLIQKVEYDSDDNYTDWSSSNPTQIMLSGTAATVNGTGVEVKDGKVSITAAGTYVVSGKLDNGQIAVKVKDKGIVRLVLNGAEIYNSSTSAIFVEEAGKTIISLQEGTTNLVSDGKTYVYPDAATDEPNSAIFSKDDLTINGTGKLVVQANYNNGITSKDKLKITGGTLAVQAVDDGLMGRDLVAVQAGDLTIAAGGHGIKTTNDKAGSEGYLSITGGTFNIESGEDALHSKGGLHIAGGDIHINAGDDGIHADVSIAIAGGKIDIAQSEEGIEAPTIVISDGQTSLVANDDGVNASSGSSETAAEGGQGGQGGQSGQSGQSGQGGQGGPKGPGGESGAASNNKLTITGGYLSVDAKGDGLDANGSIVMTGGTVIVNGPTDNGNGPLDYDGTFEMTGGFLVAAGSSGMAQATSEQSTQPGILMTYNKSQQAGAMVHMEDGEGNTILTFAPPKSYQSLFVSSPNLKTGASYTLYAGGTSTGSAAKGLYDGGEYQGGTKVVDFTTSSVITWLSESGVTAARSGMGGPGGNPGQGGGRGGMRPEGDGAAPQRAQQ
ncbi:hypothetical protein GCM10008018_35930 [Paenibacillus marchantiophytorum]|uniref:Carbohydrate-binding domain-containing protein n=1 Tax=Paenibacillus marchantiophytorum TaxID=1619310 RepID=A0ABQ1EV16_9BACL|nr:carbohydrate-binding domain-containing protein [Paenibacillus marchantiophytorum]GFZ86737.1 hypothetical protein GCM10008018_35930 [Paenibacillus marchantiophytorum]